MKSDFRSESFKRKFSVILFVNKLMIGCSIKNREKIPERQLNIGIKKPGLKFNLGLALMSLRTTGPDLEHEHTNLQSHIYPVK